MYLERGAHICHLFKSFDDQKQVALQFLVDGLNRDEACLYITGRQAVDDWFLELQASGVDVVRERKRKALAILTGAEYRQSGRFNSIVKARELLTFIRERRSHFPAVRIAGDVSWESEPAVPSDLLCHWEATANLVFEDQDACAICQYSLSCDSPSVIHAALRTHPLVILDGQMYINPFYEAQHILQNEPRLNGSCIDETTLMGLVRHISSTRPLQPHFSPTKKLH